jgi:hypothetical protein
LIRLLRTSTFRLSVVYMLLFVVSVVAVLGYIYLSTTILLARQTDDTIEAEITGLAEQYSRGGLDRLIEIVAERSARNGRGVYILTTPGGAYLAGNIPAMPEGISLRQGWVEFAYREPTVGDDHPHTALARLFRLTGGFRLLVGRDVENLRLFEGLIQSTMAWALGLTVLLGLGGGLLMSRGFLARVEAINDTSRTIMGGDLAGRVRLSGSGDELDRLAGNLNDMLDEIERLMTAMREVTDNVAHDLRTPLTRLRARLEGGLRGADARAHRLALEQGLEEADRLIATFNALLGIARIESGAGRDSLEPIDIGAAIADAAELYEPLAEEQRIDFRIEVEEGLTARADRQLIGQAVANLVDNAMKHARPAIAPPGDGQPCEHTPKVSVTAHRNGAGIEIAVSDNGPGIPAEERERVFGRFVRLEESRTGPGSGLGLSLVAAVARHHGGRASLCDNGPGLKAVIALPAATSAG